MKKYFVLYKKEFFAAEIKDCLFYRTKLKNHEYETLDHLECDLNLMFENAKRYNVPNSAIYKRVLKMQQVMQVKFALIFKGVSIWFIHYLNWQKLLSLKIFFSLLSNENCSQCLIEHHLTHFLKDHF